MLVPLQQEKLFYVNKADKEILACQAYLQKNLRKKTNHFIFNIKISCSGKATKFEALIKSIFKGYKLNTFT